MAKSSKRRSNCPPQARSVSKPIAARWSIATSGSRSFSLLPDRFLDQPIGLFAHRVGEIVSAGRMLDDQLIRRLIEREDRTRLSCYSVDTRRAKVVIIYGSTDEHR